MWGHAGIGAPAGALGGDVDVFPIRQIGLSAGAGYSFGGPQFALGARYRMNLEGGRQAFTAGPVLSWGRYSSFSRHTGFACVLLCAMEQNLESPAGLEWERAYWQNLEVGYERRVGSLAALRFAGGYGFILNPSDFTCDESQRGTRPLDAECDRSTGKSIVYAVAQVGFMLL